MKSKPTVSEMRRGGFIASKKSNLKAIKNYSTIDHKAYVFYREKTKIGTRQSVAHYVEYGKLISTFYEIVNEELADSLGGVYVKGLGYFSVLKYFKTAKAGMMRNSETNKWEKMLNYKEDYFYIAFIPISKNIRRKLFLLDYAYTKKFKDKITENIKKGYYWMCNASLFYRDKRQTIV